MFDKKEYQKQYRLNNLEKIRKYQREYAKKYRKRNPQKIQKYENRSRYGLTPEQIKNLLREQNGKCKICLIVLNTPCVDHDHSCCSKRKSCGKCIRGLLCQKCNKGLGHFLDSKNSLIRAIKYLKEYEQKTAIDG